MDRDQIEITVNHPNSAEIEEPAGAAVGEGFNAHEGSEEPDSRSEPPNLNCTNDQQELLSDVNPEEVRIHRLAVAQGLEPTKINFWKVAFEEFSNHRKLVLKQFDKTEEKICSVKNEIYQVVGFFSAFQGLLITAAAQSNLLRCNNVGFILALSAFATALAVFGIWQKIRAMEFLRFKNICNRKEEKDIYICLQELKLQGIEFNFDWFRQSAMGSRHSPTTRRELRTAFARWKKIFISYGTGLVVSVIAFGGLCMVAMGQIVCNPGHSLPSN